VLLGSEFRPRLMAEFMGTLLLVALITGAATALLSAEARRLAILDNAPVMRDPFTENLFSNSSADLMTVALTALVVLAIIFPAFARVSGGHFNPAVTFALAVTRRFNWIEVGPYVVAQCLGGIAGAFLVAAMYGQDGASIGSIDVLFGAPTLAGGVSQWQAVAAEATACLVVMLAVVATQFRGSSKDAPPWGGIVVGLAYTGAILVAGPLTGGSANPARSLGPFVASLPFDVDSIPWNDLVVYLAAPLAGAIIAALGLDAVTGRKRPRREPIRDPDEGPEPYFVVGTTDGE
ncbi:MAG: MIP/aquaporin family protein, partial [Actinomycetota bacterium]